MINSLWISKTGMEAQQMQLDVISNNLANVSTNGFKRASAVFEDLMYQNLRQVGANSAEQSQLPTGLQVGVLEGSNVNPIETMVGMIQTARQFEAQMRLLTTAEANDRSAAQLLGLQG